jgi:hypothetical protein
MKWLTRLKKISAHAETEATEPTKPLYQVQAGGFVAFVAPISAPTQKFMGNPTPANDPMPAAEVQPIAPIPNTWRELASAYHLHHFKCPTCISAGQGRGLRCGAGAALWTGYQDASDAP